MSFAQPGFCSVVYCRSGRINDLYSGHKCSPDVNLCFLVIGKLDFKVISLEVISTHKK